MLFNRLGKLFETLESSAKTDEQRIAVGVLHLIISTILLIGAVAFIYYGTTGG